jgi:uncharacterized protein YutE (UPF0331/DUF86 family)
MDSASDLGTLVDTLGTAFSSFPTEVVRKLERLPGFRNVLVHDYVTLEMKKVVEALDDLEPIETFFAIVSGLPAL